MPAQVLFREFTESDASTQKYVVREIDEATIALSDHSILVEIYACHLDIENQKIITDLFLKKPRQSWSVATSFSGIVKRIGISVSLCKVGDKVAGVLPLDSEYSACAQLCIVEEFLIVPIPSGLDYCKAACLDVGVRAFTAVYGTHIERGDTVLVLNAGQSFGLLTTQLATCWGARVYAVTTKGEDKVRLESLPKPPHRILELDEKHSTLVNTIMEETGRLGVNVVIDSGVRQFTTDVDMETAGEGDLGRGLPFKHSILSCLSVGGRWATSHPNLQLDPPDSHQLFLRNATLHFLFSPAWTLSSARQGKWLHMAKEVVDRMYEGSLVAHITQTLSFNQAVKHLEQHSTNSLLNGCIIIDMKGS